MCDILNMHSLIYQNTDSTSGDMGHKPTILKENCDCSQVRENDRMIMLHSLVYASSNTNNNCSTVLSSYKEVCVENIPEFIDICHYQHTNEPNGLQMGQSLIETVIDLTKAGDKSLSSDLCDTELNKPVNTDKKQLTEIIKDEKTLADSIVSSASIDNKFLFIKEIKASEVNASRNKIEKVVEKIRRNPVRNARNKSRNASNELLFEEDFAFLDTSDDDFKDENKIFKNPKNVNLFKELPINVYEKPEYNSVANPIEPFDYTIGALQKVGTLVKKPKRKLKKTTNNNETKRKPVIKRKKKTISENISLPETISLDTLKPLINTTTDMLKKYFVDAKNHQHLVSSNCTFENKVEVLRNQAFLFAMVNNLGEKQVIDKFEHLNLDNNEVNSDSRL